MEVKGKTAVAVEIDNKDVVVGNNIFYFVYLWAFILLKEGLCCLTTDLCDLNQQLYED